MTMWTFKKYCQTRHDDPIGDWYISLPNGARARFDAILEYFSDNSQALWTRGGRCKSLTDVKGVFEVRFEFKNILYRPLGYFGPFQGDFTFLIPANEKGGRFVPKDAPKLALERIDEIKKGKVFVNECDF